mgnify:CR=1 FL=1
MTPLPPTFTLLDYAVFGAYLLLTAAIGLWFVKGQRDLDEYFLAGRSMGSVVVSMTILAALFSGITFISGPGEAYLNGPLFYLVNLGFFVATPLTTIVFLRLYYNPLAPWIWLGAALCALGGFVSLSDRRLRVGAPRRRAQPADLLAQLPHREPVRAAHHRGIIGDAHIGARRNVFYGFRHRAQIAHAVVDDCDHFVEVNNERLTVNSKISAARGYGSLFTVHPNPAACIVSCFTQPSPPPIRSDHRLAIRAGGFLPFGQYGRADFLERSLHRGIGGRHIHAIFRQQRVGLGFTLARKLPAALFRFCRRFEQGFLLRVA